MIIERKWFDSHDVWLNAKHRKLVLPEHRSYLGDVQSKQYLEALKQGLQCPKPDSIHQADMERRDRQIEKEEQRERYQAPWKEESGQRSDMAKVSHTLQGQEIGAITTNSKPRRKTTTNQPTVQTDIAAIGAAPFQRYLEKDTEVFITSLSEIGRVLKEKRAEERQEEDRQEQELIYSCYACFLPLRAHPVVFDESSP